MEVNVSIGAGAFKTHCLELLDQVAATGEPLVITKRGRPVARLVPVEAEVPRGAFGGLAGTVDFFGDLIAPIDDRWDADQDAPDQDDLL